MAKEFDIEGLGFARMALTELAKNPKKSAGKDISIQRGIVESLYTEIRAARLAGHTWREIHAAVRENVKVAISCSLLTRLFGELDKKYEDETGVKALPREKPGRKKNKG